MTTQEENLEPCLGTEALKETLLFVTMARVEQRATECSYLPSKPIHELQGYFSSPSCLALELYS